MERHVPDDRLLRAIDRVVERRRRARPARAILQPDGAALGRSRADDPNATVGYCLGIRSGRRLCEEVHLNLAYRWFCRLDLADRVPDHSTFSKSRHGRFRESDLLREVFEATVRASIAAGLVGGERFALDAGLIEADANKRRAVKRADWDADAIDPKEAPRAVREYLAVLDDAAFGAASDAEPKLVSPADPAAQWSECWAANDPPGGC